MPWSVRRHCSLFCRINGKLWNPEKLVEGVEICDNLRQCLWTSCSCDLSAVLEVTDAVDWTLAVFRQSSHVQCEMCVKLCLTDGLCWAPAFCCYVTARIMQSALFLFWWACHTLSLTAVGDTETREVNETFVSRPGLWNFSKTKSFVKTKTCCSRPRPCLFSLGSLETKTESLKSMSLILTNVQGHSRELSRWSKTYCILLPRLRQ